MQACLLSPGALRRARIDDHVVIGRTRRAGAAATGARTTISRQGSLDGRGSAGFARHAGEGRHPGESKNRGLGPRCNGAPGRGFRRGGELQGYGQPGRGFRGAAELQGRGHRPLPQPPAAATTTANVRLAHDGCGTDWGRTITGIGRSHGGLSRGRTQHACDRRRFGPCGRCMPLRRPQSRDVPPPSSW